MTHAVTWVCPITALLSRARTGTAGKRVPQGRAVQDTDPHVTPGQARGRLQLPDRQELSALPLFLPNPGK